MQYENYLESRRLARGKLDKAFTKKFNPIDDVLEKLDEIDKQSRADAIRKEAAENASSVRDTESQLDRDRLNETIRSNMAEDKRIADKDKMAADDRDAMLEEKKAEAAKVKAADQLKMDVANRSEAVSSARALKPMIDANAKITPADLNEAVDALKRPPNKVERAPGIKEVMSPTGDLVAKGKFSGSNELFQAVDDLDAKMAAELKTEQEKAEALKRSNRGGGAKPIDPKKQQLLDARLEATIASKEKAEFEKTYGKAPAPAQINPLIDLRLSAEYAKKIREQAKNIKTGPVVNFADSIATTLGIQSGDMASIQERLYNGLADYMHKMTGAAASVPETERLKRVVASLADGKEAFLSKLDTFIKDQEDAYGIISQELVRAGVNPEYGVKANGKDPLANPF